MLETDFVPQFGEQNTSHDRKIIEATYNLEIFRGCEKPPDIECKNFEFVYISSCSVAITKFLKLSHLKRKEIYFKSPICLASDEGLVADGTVVGVNTGERSHGDTGSQRVSVRLPLQLQFTKQLMRSNLLCKTSIHLPQGWCSKDLITSP
jgi:hypothetical protein